MKAILPLYVFIDACGWEIIKQDPFALRFAPHRRRLTSVFGYSSACVPSIVSGRWPVEHRNWCYFVYDPKHSPFGAVQALRCVPRAIAHRRTFRRHLSRLVKRLLGFEGYFDLYNIPFKHISLFNFTERKSPLRPGGLNCGKNIFDWKNRLRHLRLFGPRGILVSNPGCYPRERLLRSLPLLLWAGDLARQPEVVGYLQRQLLTPAADWNGLLASYKRIWAHYG